MAWYNLSIDVKYLKLLIFLIISLYIKKRL
jgi:hypothetical protein